MFNGEANSAKKHKEVLIKVSEEGYVIVKGERRADQCSIVHKKEGIGKPIVSPWEQVFDGERQVKRRQDRAEGVALGDAIVTAISAGRG